MKHIVVNIRIINMQQELSTDAELIKKSLAGDLTAFSLIVKRYQEEIVNYSRGLTKDPDLADDASQETFIKLYLNLKKIDRKRPLKPWLYTVAKNYCFDKFRKEKRIIPLTDNIPQPNEPFIERIIKKDEFAAILTAFKKLPEKYRLTLYARFFQGLSYVEIAKVLKVPVNTIKTHIKRGRQLLITYTQITGVSPAVVTDVRR